jgi:hypothetical protein
MSVPEVMKMSKVMKVGAKWCCGNIALWLTMPKLCGLLKLCIPPALCMPPIIMPPIIEWADITGAACIATTTTHPIVILRSITILPIGHSENAMQNVQMTIDLISDRLI